VLHSHDPPEELVPLTREDPSAFSPPPAFGPFRVLHQIGIGALGPVFRTYEPTRDRLVAVKVFRLDIIPEQAQALAAALERATRSSLFHPSIVEPIAAGVQGTLAYRAEEYVAAESLDVAMRHYAPAALEKALPFITQLAGAVDFARAAGVGHGGLHPRDIFLTPDEARATGFGVVEALEEVGIRAPTRRPYAAPERIDGTRWSTPADVFSLAAISFELLTGRRPAGTGSQIGALPDSAQSAAVQRVLARAMDDDPSKRFQTALAFAAALEAAARGEAVQEAVPAAAVPAPAVTAPAIVPPLSSTAAAPPPGEFAVEKQVDPLLAALDDKMKDRRSVDAAPASGRPLFDVDEMTPAGVAATQKLDALDRVDRLDHDHGGSDPDPLDDLVAPEPPRFARDFALDEKDDLASGHRDAFVREQKAEAERRRPLEALHETSPRSAPERPMFVEPERTRPGMLSHALMLLIGVIAGSTATYYLSSREPVAPPVTQAAAPSAPQAGTAAASGPATPEKPGQYSEQKVAPAPAATPPVTATPPPTAETRPPASAPPPRGAAPVATTGRLVVTSTPPRAGVLVNGTWRGRTPLTLADLAPGHYVVRVTQPGYVPARDEFTLGPRDRAHEFAARLYREPRAGEAASRPAARTPAPAPTASGRGAAETFTGSLYVDSRPRGATVFVDGRSVGQTPLSLPDVPVGSHVVRLELTGKRTWTASTRVTSGQTARVTGSLEDRDE